MCGFWKDVGRFIRMWTAQLSSVGYLKKGMKLGEGCTHSYMGRSRNGWRQGDGEYERNMYVSMKFSKTTLNILNNERIKMSMNVCEHY